MPELNETLDAETTTGIDTTVVPVVTETDKTEGVVETTVVDQPKKAAKVKKEKVVKAEKVKPEKAEKVVAEEKFIRPPMEQLTKDFETMLADQEISGKKIVKLGYKCGKIIYGLKHADNESKDFRVIAFKARKKSKSVNGKSRCIFYFGMSQAKAKEMAKAHPEVEVSKFGKCSVQSHNPIELILDRTTYTEKFDKNIDKVNSLMTKLVAATIECKTEQYAEIVAKAEAAAAPAAEKTSKKKAKKD